MRRMMLHKTTGVALVALVAAFGCRGGEVETGAGTVSPAPAPPTADVLPPGTDLQVELTQTLGTAASRVGDRFTATVEQPVVAQNGDVAVPRGAVVHGAVTGLDESDHVGDPAAIRLNFESLQIDDQRHPLTAEVVDTDVDIEDRGLEDVAEEAGVGAAAGAALGAILTGDLLDTLLGGVLGAGAGTVIGLGTGDVEAALPAGTELHLRTTQRIRLD